MKLIYTQNKLKLIIEDELLNQLGKLRTKYYPNEFGGFLIGNYSDDFKTVYITNYILPKNIKGFLFVFERYIDGLVDVFKNIFKEKKQYYIESGRIRIQMVQQCIVRQI
ncbi:MAG: hypothetical protein IPJ74_20570 [Saprospiraceae bacterium]|nr:hypothetical protein [Saprospiraceae bacterium]